MCVGGGGICGSLYGLMNHDVAFGAWWIASMLL